MPRTIAAVVLCTALSFTFTPSAEAQVASSCLRPFAIPDKWLEEQSRPSTGADTFDPATDAYIPELGYQPLQDDGKALSLRLGSPSEPATMGRFLSVRVGGSGPSAYFNDIADCAGVPYRIGDSVAVETGYMPGPTRQGVEYLIMKDPTARWDAERNQVVDSAFAQSPRVIALPVFDPYRYATQVRQTLNFELPIARIVGFFVESVDSSGIVGYLTAYSTLTALPVTAQLGDLATLSATLEAPGAPLTGVPVEFFLQDWPVGTATTDENGVATLADVDAGALHTGSHPGVIRARLADSIPFLGAFLRADESTADLTVERKIPAVSWEAGRPIRYGTPLGASELNAFSDVPGQFFYTPAAGTILHSGDQQVLTVRFVPDDEYRYQEVTVDTTVDVIPAPLTISVAAATKLYLEPLPVFTFKAGAFVNGDTIASLSGAVSFDTVATEASAVGSYPVYASGLWSTDYAIQYEPGLLAVLPRSTQTSVTPGLSSTTFGQMLRVLVSVSSALGSPTGSVELLADQTVLETRMLVNGSVVFDVSGLLPGTRTLQARFAGSSGFVASASAPVTHVVNPAASNTTLSVTPSPSTYGQVVTLIARVVTLLGSPATGAVQFRDGTTVLGTAILSPQGDAAVAVLSSAHLHAGSHQVSADYLGSPTVAPSTSPVVTTSVAASATTVQLVTSPNPSRTGEAVAMRATVSAVTPGGGIPSGVVEFYIGTTRIGTAALVNGTGTVAISSLKSGKHQVQARYLATQNHAASASPLLLHTVKGGK